MGNVCAILLAAGKSSRMKEPKQLMNWNGKSLIQHQIELLSELSLPDIFVVLGCQAKTILQTVSNNDPRISYLQCPNYEEGLSASIKFGLQQASKQQYDGVLVMLVDIPLIQTNTIKLVYDTGATHLITNTEPFAIQPQFKNKPGHPVFIGGVRSLHVHSLHGDIGLKPLIKQMKTRVILDTDDIGVVYDIDTPQAYNEALRISQAGFY